MHGGGAELGQCLHDDNVHAREHEQRTGGLVHRVGCNFGEQLDVDDLHARQHRPHPGRVVLADHSKFKQ